MVGFLLVLLAGFSFCFQNVIVRILFHEYSLFGDWQTGGFVTANLHNSFLLLFMRMAVGVPLMALLNSQLYPDAWKDMRRLSQPSRRPTLLLALGGGLLMFLYLAFLYVSIGQIPTGIALTLFFTYPVFTALLSWWLLGSRPSTFRWLVMGLILLGSILTIPQSSSGMINPWLGVACGVIAGLAYGLYTVVAQKCFESFHPVPFTWMSFSTTLILSALCLASSSDRFGDLPWTALWIGGLLSAIATFVGHVLYNLGIRQIGATAAAMIGATNPALTAVLAWVAIQEQLRPIQILGVVLVTFSVALLGRERSHA